MIYIKDKVSAKVNRVNIVSCEGAVFHEEKNLGGAMIFRVLIRFKESRFHYLSSIRLTCLMSLSLMLLFSCLTVGAVSAATYYVALTGNNSNLGSATAPFKTIQKAASIVNPGDTVIVKDGVYIDTYSPGYLLYLTRGGTAGNVITFKAENKWGAVLDGQNTSECVSFTKTSNYIRIENFELKNCYPVGIASNDDPGATNVFIFGNHIHHCSHDGITLNHSSNNWKIDSNLIHDVYTPYPNANQYHGIYTAGSSSNWTISNNIIYDIPYGWPIHIFSGTQSNGKIVNNVFADAVNTLNVGLIIIAASAPDLLIGNNIIYNPPGGAVIRAYSDNNGRNVIVRNNLTNVANMCSGTYCSGLTFSSNLTSTNPLFVDYNNRNYHLQSNSPAINAGYNYADRSYDADRKSIVGVPDIGAYEYSSPTPAPAPGSPALIQ